MKTKFLAFYALAIASILALDTPIPKEECVDGKIACDSPFRCCCPPGNKGCDCCKSEQLCCNKLDKAWCCGDGTFCGAVANECKRKCADGTECPGSQKCCGTGKNFCCNSSMVCCKSWCCPHLRKCGSSTNHCVT